MKEVKKLFSNNPLYLFSMSWGSVLSALVASRYPQLVDGVVVSGQVINDLFLCDEVINTLADSAIPKRKLDRIRQIIAQPLTTKDLQLISSSINKYTDGYINKKGNKIPTFPIIWGLLTSPDYRFRDFKAIVNNGYRKSTALPLWRELLQVDLSETLESIAIPYRIFQGDTDIVTSTKTIEKLIGQTTNDNLQLNIVRNTGHIPGVDMMEKVLESLSHLAKS
ncbi:alpha/beta fold hydrolase [Streptococcus dentasini]